MQNQCPSCTGQMIGDAHYVTCESCGIIQPTTGFCGSIPADCDDDTPPVEQPRFAGRRPFYRRPSFIPGRPAKI
jgi:hypothetical protein